ncbi:hypothetical protein Glove_267g60 [Diversispora epigaea]|uniref:HMG box domain-containing protein n=1 Tax=Diversispora epigaea TaxID=1348612 RepID=A0A397ID67_9GLOM|nr:hypothetical protein Glove_267g60 [Diversispora epigaea]
MNNFDTLLSSINRNNIHPPPEIDEVLNLFNSNKPMRDHSRCHAYKIFRYSVTKEYKRIGEFNVTLIRKAADHLWKNSTSHENKLTHTSSLFINDKINSQCRLNFEE